MLSQFLWWSSMAMEALLIGRGLATGLSRRFPIFYGYLFFVLAQEILSFFIYRWDPHAYTYFFWSTEFLAVAIGCGVVLEIYRNALSSFSGAARMARVLLTGVFLVAVLKGAITAAGDPDWWLQANTLEIDRALRTVQATGILALMVLFLFYAIPFGRNLRGLLLGYGLFIGVDVACLMFVPPKGHGFWFYATSASYSVVLSVWIFSLWSPSEIHERVGTGLRLENDYQRVAAGTRRRLESARGYLEKAVRP